MRLALTVACLFLSNAFAGEYLCKSEFGIRGYNPKFVTVTTGEGVTSHQVREDLAVEYQIKDETLTYSKEDSVTAKASLFYLERLPYSASKKELLAEVSVNASEKETFYAVTRVIKYGMPFTFHCRLIK